MVILVKNTSKLVYSILSQAETPSDLICKTAHIIKIPINPDYVKEITATEIILQNFQGKEYRYPLNVMTTKAINQDTPEFYGSSIL